MKKVIATTVAALCMVSAVLPCMAFTASATDGTQDDTVTISDNTMYNDSIKIKVNKTTGNLVAYTTGGDPDNENDDNQKILYEGYSSNTSFKTVSIDGVVSSLKQTSVAEDLVFDADSKRCTAVKELDGITVTETYTIQKSVATGRYDMIKVNGNVKNNTENTHQVGFRIMLDTQLGSCDNAPFRIPGVGSVINETELSGDQIPQYFQVFNSLSDPTIITQGLFDLNGNTPDRVQFADWQKVKNTVYHYEIDSDHIFGDSSGDSAVTSEWDEKDLAAGEERNYTMYYGLGGMVVSENSPLTLSVYGDKNATPAETKDKYKDVTITAYVLNNTGSDLTNVPVTIALPEEMSLTADSIKTITLDSLKIGEEKQVSWNVSITPLSEDKTLEYSVIAGTEDLEAVVNTDINVPALDIEVPTEPETLAPTEPETTVPTEPETTVPTEPETTVPTELETAAPTQTATAAPTSGTVKETTTSAVSSATNSSETTTSAASSTDGKTVDTGDNSFAPIVFAAAVVLLGAGFTVSKLNRKKVK